MIYKQFSNSFLVRLLIKTKMRMQIRTSTVTKKLWKFLHHYGCAHFSDLYTNTVDHKNHEKDFLYSFILVSFVVSYYTFITVIEKKTFKNDYYYRM